MKRKFFGTVLLFCALICLMGANSISFNAKQPMPNPGGKKATIEANGTYTLDPGHTLDSVGFSADDGLKSSWTAYAGSGNWSVGPVGLPAGTYKCTAELAVNDGTKIWLADKTVKDNVVVK